MSDRNPQVGWTEEQWARVRQVISEEANRARVAASFLPLYGPLPADTDFVPKDAIHFEPKNGRPQSMTIEDKTSVQLATLQVKVNLRGAQLADPAQTSALQLFRRAANVLARLEDAVIFRGQPGGDPKELPKELAEIPAIWEIIGGKWHWEGLLNGAGKQITGPAAGTAKAGEDLVTTVSNSIGLLEASGHLGPFALVFGHQYFTDVQSPSPSLVLPQDRIIPFLGGGPLLRSSTLPPASGVIIALGGAPIDLVVATDVTLQFLQVTTEPMSVFRIYEKIVLRIKEATAIVRIEKPGVSPTTRK